MPAMLGVALALVAIGVVTLLIIPWVGVPLGVVGVILLVVYAVGGAKRTRERRL